MAPASNQRAKMRNYMYFQNNNTIEINLKDKINLTFFKGPASNTRPDNSEPIEWDEFSQLLSQPKQGLKDGSYFVRAKCTGNRNDNNTDPLSSIIVIDGDSGPNGDPCPQPDYAADTLSDLGFQFILYTSHSHTPEKPKYRILFLLDRKVCQSESKLLYEGIVDLLSKNGVRIQKNSESATWSQPWFLPRYETEEQQKYFFHGEGGFKGLPVDEILPMVTEQENIVKNVLSPDQILKLKKGTPPCIGFWANETELETTDHRNFNLIKMILVAYGLSAGLDEVGIISLCRKFIDEYAFSNSLKTPEARLSNFKKCRRSMKQSQCVFSCATVRALGAPENAFNCKDCHVEKPYTVEDILEWIDNTKKKKDILDGWIEKTKGMDAVSTDTVIKAISQKTGVGTRPLKKDLKTLQKTWRFEKNQKTKDQKAKKRTTAGIKEIIYKGTATGEAVIQVSEALKQLKNVYRYGSSLVSIVDSRPESVRTVQRSHGSGGAYFPRKVIHRYTIETCRHDLEKVACCTGFDNRGEKIDIMFPVILIRGFMDAPNTNDRPLTGIVVHPFINADYIPTVKQGYDRKTGLFISFHPDLVLNFNASPSPSKTQAKAAYRYLRDDVMADFPFASELDLVGAISILLTALQRKMITGDSGCPGYEVDAPTQATGKTALMQMISYSIYDFPIAATGWSDSDEEMGKHLLGILLEGHSCVLFDNLPQGTTLESNELAKAMTNPTYSRRLLSKNETVTVPSQVLWLFTGNNISISGDFNTRVLQIRLDANMANPDRRKFKRPDLGAWCQENRTEIIQACMTIILANKGINSAINPTRFREWDKFVRMPLFEMTGIDIGCLFERNKAADPKNESQENLLESWYDAFGEQPFTAMEVLQQFNMNDFDKSNSLGKLEDALKDIFSGSFPTTGALGKKLGSFKGRIVGKYRMSNVKGTSRKQLNKTCWQVVKVKENV